MLCFRFHWLLTISALLRRQPHPDVHLHGDGVRDGGDDDGSVDGDLQMNRNKIIFNLIKIIKIILYSFIFCIKKTFHSWTKSPRKKAI